MAEYEYGIVKTAGAYGLLQNLEVKHKIKHVPLYGPDGEVVDYTDVDEQYEVTADFIYDTTTAVKAGDIIEAGGASYHLHEVTEKGTFNDHLKLSFSGCRYVKNTIPSGGA